MQAQYAAARRLGQEVPIGEHLSQAPGVGMVRWAMGVTVDEM